MLNLSASNGVNTACPLPRLDKAPVLLMCQAMPLSFTLQSLAVTTAMLQVDHVPDSGHL